MIVNRLAVLRRGSHKSVIGSGLRQRRARPGGPVHLRQREHCVDRAVRRATARICLPALFLLALPPACSGGPVHPVSSQASSPAREPADAERSAAALIRDWFARLASDTSDSHAALLQPMEASFELTRPGGTTRDAAEIEAWLGELRSPHPRVEFTIDALRVTPAEAGLYELRFEVDRRADDVQGLSHVARSEHTWFVRMRPGSPPAIARIEARPVLSFPGTGPRIICN